MVVGVAVFNQHAGIMWGGSLYLQGWVTWVCISLLILVAAFILSNTR